MKRFVLKISVFSFVIAVSFIPVEFLIRRIPNDYSYKNDYLDKYSDEIQIIILGSSHEYYGINPDYFSKKTFNASYVAQSLNYDFKIFSKYKNSFNSLEIIVLPMSYYALWYNLKDDNVTWRESDYTLYYGIKADFFKDNFELSGDNLKYDFVKIYKHYIKNRSYITCSKLGWGTIYEYGSDLQETGKTTSKRHTVDIFSEKRIKIMEEKMEILNSFSDFCNQRNVKLIFVATPTYYTYRENLNTEQLNKTHEIINEFINKHSNCYYFDWFEDADFIAEDFYDADHLNAIGAEKLTKKLLQKIDSLEILK